jgi:hypothetical protein
VPTYGGEGNSNFSGNSFTNAFRIETSTWDIVHGLNYQSSADKRAPLGGFLTVAFYYNGFLPYGGQPFVLMGSLQSYGSQPLVSLPGEPNVIGIGANIAPIFFGTYGFGFPSLTFQVPVTAPPLVGLYLQAAVVDPTAPNGFRISNSIRGWF